ncbi:MAG TPA: hypothetical protein VGL00_12155 [Terracidiphilus sp.]|jgi:hypothetical protein
MATTEHAGVTFTVKESADGTPWLMVDFDEPGLSFCKGSDFIGLRFSRRLTIEQAEAFKDRLNGMIEGMSFTKF